MTAAGLIFANVHDDSISELTSMRTMASVPFGARYRLIDFPLSNMVNSGISTIGLVTSYNYRSLLDHIGNGKDWDLARRSAGIKILPPNITAYDTRSEDSASFSKLGSLTASSNFISRCGADVIVLSDCDTICNIDLSAVIGAHLENRADLTVVTKHFSDDHNHRVMSRNSVITSDASGRITEVTAFSPYEWRGGDISTNIIVADRRYLLSQISAAATRGYTSFFRDVMARNASRDRFFVYRFSGYYSFVNSISGYYESSMDLLDRKIRGELFGNAQRPILTKVRNSAPAIYREGASVRNSVIADGCLFEGEVENSVIFRGVKIGRGAKVRNSIVMQDTIIEDNASLDCVIIDKNSVVRDNVKIAGHPAMPFFIGKGIML